jgi:hypothetical protein
MLQEAHEVDRVQGGAGRVKPIVRLTIAIYARRVLDIASEQTADRPVARRSTIMTKDEIKVLTPIGMLGYGIPERFLKMGADMALDVIALDAGSTDSGPQKLGLGDMTCSRQAYERDIAMLLEVRLLEL